MTGGLRDDSKPAVLFLCVHNAGRSQMAMGFFTHLAGDAAVAWSGGSEPADEVNPAAIAAMRERGPAGQDLAAVRAIRDEIERRVRQLLSELKLPVR